MGYFHRAIKGLEQPEPQSIVHEHLVGLHAEVHPDGDSASVAVQFTNQPAFRVYVPITQAAEVMTELNAATALMVQRQSFKLDKGASKLLEMCETAMRPAAIEVIVDPVTHDSVFIHHFAGHQPITIRISAEELPIFLAKLAAAISRSAN